MANEVDQLSLKIDIKATNEDATTIKSIASAIRSLNTAVKNTANISNYVNELSRMAKVFKSFNSGKASQPKSMLKQKKETVSRTRNVGNIQSIGGQPSNYGQLKVTKIDLKKSKEYGKNIKDIDKEQNKATKSSIKLGSSFKNLVKSIGRIAFYRMIRTAIKEVVQAFTEGITNLRTENKQLDKSLKQIKTSFTGIKNSIASLLVPIINALAPVITKIADDMANYVNRIEEARAALKGESTYTKIITSDMEEYKKQIDAVNGSLAEYDKFSSLNQKKEYSGVTTADVTMDVESAKEYKGIIESIDKTAQEFANFMYELWDKIKSFIAQLKDFFENNKQFISSLINGLKVIGGFLIDVIAPVLKFIMGIIQVIVGVFQWLIGSIEAIFGKTDTFFKGINNIGAGAGNAFGGNYGWYADGGTFTKGTAFIAGEAGAEAVYNTSGGNGGVVNIEQFTSAMYNALVAYGAAKDKPNGGSVYLDGTKVGQLVEKSVYNEGVRVGHFGK